MNNFRFVNDTEELVSDLTREISRLAHKDMEVTFIPSIIKDGVDVPAVQIGGVGENVKANFYLTEEFLNRAEDYYELVDNVIDAWLNSETPEIDMDLLTEFMNSWESVSARVIPVVYNKRRYSEVYVSKDLEGTPMAVFYRIPLSQEMSTSIRNDMLEKWGISIDELHSQAMSNLTATESNYSVRDMNEIIAEMMPGCVSEDLPEKQMLVGTNTEGLLGANIMLLKNMMKRVKDIIGNFFILPSSVHELIFVPTNSDAGRDAVRLAEIVDEVNEAEVSQADYLAGGVYTYDFDKESIVDVMSDREKYLSFLIANCG